MTTWALDIQRGWKWGLALLGLFLVLAAAMITIAVLTPSPSSPSCWAWARGSTDAGLYLGYLLRGLMHAAMPSTARYLHHLGRLRVHHPAGRRSGEIGPSPVGAEGCAGGRGLHWPGHLRGYGRWMRRGRE